MKYKSGDDLFVVDTDKHNFSLGEVVTFVSQDKRFLYAKDCKGTPQGLLPNQVVPYYDLEAIGFNYKSAFRGELSEAFSWDDTPDVGDFWSEQYDDGSLSTEGQERLAAMIKQYEVLEALESGVISSIKSVECTMQELEDWMLGSEHVCGKCEDSQNKTPQGISESVGTSPDGGPQGYYDLPEGAVTLNDLIESKSHSQWLGDSFHLSNILKATWRWGIKEGTSKEYDARKFIYSGARLLMYYAGKEAVRDTIYKMLDDKQFGGKDD